MANPLQDTYRLNVIFHGPFLFVVYRDRIEALAADIEEHDFGAGTWHEETPCSPNTYTLQGITAQQCQMKGPDSQTHVILDANAVPIKVPKKAYYRFVLQRLPSLMATLGRLTPKSPDLFTGDDIGKINVPPQIGSAHLFSYIIDKDDKLELDNLSWSPEVKKVSSNVCAVNLHIFSEAPFDLGTMHPNGDFNLMMEMLPGLSLKLAQPFPDIEFELNLDVRALGVADEEQGGLRGLPTVLQSRPISDSKLIATRLIPPLTPPLICDSPSLVITNAT